MIIGMGRNEQVPPTEPSDRFLSLVLELDAALHEGRLPEITETKLQGLCPAEQEQLARIRRQLEQRYTNSSDTEWSDLSATRIDNGEDSGNDSIDDNVHVDCGVSPELQAAFGIHDTQFGRFEILHGLGMGGHGVVFLARDPVLDRLIALKVPRPDVLVLSSMRKRFIAEGRAAALLTHPNIVTVFESGEVGSICYLAQDYIPGPTLAAWLRDHPQPVAPRIAAEMILPLAEAISLAHSRQILHRDIKPGNILLAPKTTATGIDDLRELVPKLADFGMAKLLQDPDQTRTGGALGTPAYMSPEQAAGRKDLIGGESDIYSLGTVLYEMLTHRPAHKGENDLETLQQVLHHDPPPPRALLPDIPRDLEAICLKCLRHDPPERYRTAQELAHDLRRFLEGRPVIARPQTVWSTLYYWSRRNPAMARLSTLLIVAVIGMLAGSLWFSARLLSYSTRLSESLQIARQHEQDLEVRTLTLRRRIYAEDLLNAADAWQAGKAVEARQRFEACLPQPGESDLRSFPWWMLSHQIQNSSRVIGTLAAGAVSASVAVHPAGNLVACGEPDGVIRLRSLPAGELIGELRGHAPGTINDLNFSRVVDQSRLVSAGDDGTVRVWDVNAKQELLVLRGHRGEVAASKFIGQDAEAIASGGEDRIIRIWDSHSGHLRSELAGHTETIRSLVEQSDTGILFSAGQDLTVRAWEWKSGLPDPRFPDGQLPVPRIDGEWARSLALSPDGTVLAAGFRSGRLLQWVVARQHPRFGQLDRSQMFTSGIRTLTWHDDDTLVVGFADARILLNRRDQRAEYESEYEYLPGHSDWVLSLADVPGGNDLISASKDGTIRFWPGTEIDGQIRVPSRLIHEMSAPVWQGSILTVAMQGEVFGYTMPEGTQLFQLALDDLPIGAWTCATRDGSKLLTTERNSRGQFLTAFEITTGTRVWQLPLGNHYASKGSFSPDGKSSFVCADHELWSVEVETGQRQWLASHPLSVTDLQFLPQTSQVVTTCMDGKVRFWDAATGQLVQEQTAHQNSAQQLTVSQNGKLLATAGEDLWVRVWRIADWREIASLGLNSELAALYFTDDDRTIITFDNKQITFWSIPDQIKVMRWQSPSRLAISPDHKTLVIQRLQHVRLLRGTP